MKERKWTEAQEKAINHSGTNILVSAAAGSGKTAVMITKIFNLIKNGSTSVDRLLVVTFTNAAAASMRKKLKEQFDAALSENPDNEYLLKQKRLLDRANISTIHSYCQKLLQRYYCKTDLAPDFTILNATQDEMYSEYALNKTLEEFAKKYEDGSYPEYMDALELFSNGYNDDSLAEKIKYFTKKMSYIIDKDAFKSKVINSYKDFSVWDNHLCEELNIIARLFIDYYEMLIEKFKGQSGFDKIAVHAEKVIGLLSETFSEKTPSEKLSKICFKSNFSSSIKKSNPQYGAISSRILELRKNIKKYFENISVLSDEEKIKSANAVRALFDMSEKYREYYDAKCNENGAVSFDGILDKTIKLLDTEPAIKQELKDEIDYLFVDEYQDVNAKLEKIVLELSREDNLFFVGDVKQSIYKFMEAKPQLFINKINDYQSGVLGTIFYLSNNFRSLKAILDGINQIFESCMHENLFEVEYDENAKLYPGPDKQSFQYENVLYTNGIPENPNEFLISYKYNSYLKKDKIQENVLSEPEVIADRIVQLCANSTLRLKKEVNGEKVEIERKVTYNDIVILGLTNGVPEKLDETFKKYGIPFRANEKIDKESFDIIGAIISLLKLLVIRREDKELITVMLSCIGCFTLEELAKIRIEKPDNEYKIFYDALVSYRIDGSDVSIKNKIDEFICLIDKLQVLQLTMTLPDFIEYVYRNTGFMYHIAFMKNSYVQENKIDILMSNAKYYSENNTGGLRGFLEYYKNISFSEKNEANFDENDNSVHYMTVHKSKGLEFPIVFLIGTGDTFKQESPDFDEELGFCVKMRNADNEKTSTAQNMVFASAGRQSNVSEKLRLLYVALTRAQYKLIVSINDTENAITSCAYFPNPLTVYMCNSWTELLIPIIYGSEYGAPLRNLINDTGQNEFDDGNGLWNVKIVKNVSIPANTEQKNDETFDAEAYIENVQERIDWKYEHINATSMRTKQNPSKSTEHKPLLLRKPKSIDEDIEYKGAQKGTIVHFFMEHFDFTSDKNALTQAEEMLSEGIITQKEFEELPMERITAFTESAFAQRMKKASSEGKLFKERSFCQTFKIDGTEDETLVQGTIDCYFFEDDHIVLLDYKTDKIHNDLGKHVEHHSVQLNMYKNALENLYENKKVVPYLHFFDINSTIDINNYQNQ